MLRMTSREEKLEKPVNLHQERRERLKVSERKRVGGEGREREREMFAST